MADNKKQSIDWLAVSDIHPLRKRIVNCFANAGKPISPNMVAKELSEGLSQVSYHIKVLREMDKPAVELVKTEPRRGAVEHFYKLAAHVLKKE